MKAFHKKIMMAQEEPSEI